MKHDESVADGAGNDIAGQSGGRLNRHLLAQGFEVIQPFFQTLDTLRDTVLEQARLEEALLEQLGLTDPGMGARLTDLAQKIDSFEASVTLLGQVKAGKTALVNVLSGNVGLLPSDVNPWTTTVTSLHINDRNACPKTRAAFRFFDHDEWDRMMREGGRLGELAARAGAQEDLARLRAQIAVLRASVGQRLSGNFETLLGRTHKYGYADRELIERYACPGDPDELERNPKSPQGRFSDITRSADIWLDLPETGGPYLMRDTPGVNDTFLMREQITLEALRESQICVLVLSAHEALNSSDLALLRLISGHETHQVVIFVNRIDELASPSVQVPEIRESIAATLKSYDLLKDVSVLFGSARWAEMALSGDCTWLDGEAGAALEDWAAEGEWAGNGGTPPDADQASFLWQLSGVPGLLRLINERIVDCPGARHLAEMRAALTNITSALAARDALEAGRDIALRLAELNPGNLEDELQSLAARARRKLEETLARLESELRPALVQVQEDYISRATDSLIWHLCQKSGQESWTFNSSGLRLVLRTTCDRFAARARARVGSVFYGAAMDLCGVYLGTLGLEIEGFHIEPPQVPKAPTPVMLGKTIAIDLGNNWWKRWWQRCRNPATIAAEYRDLIAAEIGAVIGDLHENQISGVFSDMRGVLDEFLAEQAGTVLDLQRQAAAQGLACGRASGAPGEPRDFGAVISVIPGAFIAAGDPEDPAREDGISDMFGRRQVAGGYR